MKKIVSFIKNIIISIWVLIAIVSTICLISYNDYSVSEIGNYSIIIADSDRLEPTFKENDLIIVKKVSENKYNEGDYAFFYISNPSDFVFINYGKITKKVEVDHAEDSYYFGDDLSIPYSDMIGLANGSIVYHGWGLVLSIFESRWGFMFLVIFPTIFAIVYEVYSIIEEAKRDKDEDADE
jgi:hypothetical protein